jgi:hypothetical protein
MQGAARLDISAYIPKSGARSDNQSLLKSALALIEKKLRK